MVGLARLGLNRWADIIPDTAGQHGLASGAAGAMILAVMARTTLAYSGCRQIVVGGTVPLLVLVHTSALLRIGAAFFPFAYVHLLTMSALAWAAVFAVFLSTYGVRCIAPNARRIG